MSKRPNVQLMILLATHGLWAFLITLWNDFFAFLPIYFYMVGIFAILPATRLDFPRGFTCAVLSGCFLDAAFPTPFGFHACLLAIACVALRAIDEETLISRRRMPVVAALIINFIFFTSLHAWFTFQTPQGGEILHGRACIDLICSEVLLVIAFPWLLDLHKAFLNLAGMEKAIIQNSAS